MPSRTIRGKSMQGVYAKLRSQLMKHTTKAPKQMMILKKK